MVDWVGRTNLLNFCKYCKTLRMLVTKNVIIGGN